jgi:hypothetical protein
MNMENDSKWLFKYMPFNFNAVKLLTNNELWFGKPDTQNDPNEAEFILRTLEKIIGIHEFRIAIQDELEYLISRKESDNQYLNGFENLEFENNLKKIVRDYLGICSMSTICNDILMWAHYADNNKGICLVFDKDILTNSLTMHSDKVSYSSSITNANFFKTGKTGQLILDRIFYMEKLDNWKYESEFRFVIRYNDRIAQDNVDRLESFPENAIIGIILGENFPKENFKTLINLVYLRNSKREFYFWKSAKNLYKQSMDIIEISDKNVSIYLSQNHFPFQHILYQTKNNMKHD